MDSDFALAMMLQAEENKARENEDATLAWSQNNGYSSGAAFNSSGNTPTSIVDQSWETIDPTPDVRAMFLSFNDKYFWGKLAGCEVKWSPRMTSCAGICCYEGRGGLCSIRLSEPLLKLRPRKDLVETLLHEMIHAYLFVTDNNKDHDGHGPEFCKHMNRINGETGTNITIYHSFHDEVNLYKTHWWRCDGPCQNRPPYYGYVKRAMNRAPSERDPWWNDHRQKCNGKFIKIKEPEGYGQKKNKGKNEMKSPEKPKGVPDIRSMFGGNKETKSGGNGSKNTSKRTGKSTTLINPGRPDSTPIDSDSGKENETNSTVNRPASVGGNATVVGGVLNRPKPADSGPDDDKPFAKRGISTLFKPIENPKGDNKSSTQTWKVDNSVKTTVKPNIHTISSSKSQKNDTQEFSGTGHVLGNKLSHAEGVESSTRPDFGTIVRRIPGIGLIRSERPRDSNTKTFSSTDTVTPKLTEIETNGSNSASLFTSDSENDVGDIDLTPDLSKRLGIQRTPNKESAVLVRSSSSQESLSPSVLEEVPKQLSKSNKLSPLPGLNGAASRFKNVDLDNAKPSSSSDESVAGTKRVNSGINSNGKRVYMPYFSSDDDDSDILFRLRRSGDSDSPPTKRRNIDQAHRSTYPSVCSKKSIKYKKTRIFGKKSFAPTKGNSSRASNRNQRGFDLDDNLSNETTDDEERNSLSSALGNTEKDTRDGSRSRTPYSDILEISDSNSRPNSSNSGKASSVHIMTDSDQSVSLLNSPDGQGIKVESPSLTPKEALGIDLDMSQFSAHKRTPKYTTPVKKPVPITPPRPSSSYAGTPGLKRSSDEHGILRKRFRLNSSEYLDKPNQSSDTTKRDSSPEIVTVASNSQSSTGSAFQPYNRTDSQEDRDPIVDCPSCVGRFRTSEINDHLDVCLNMLPDLI